MTNGEMSKLLMAPSFVRGNVVYVHSTPPVWAGAVSPMKGDRLTVGVRKKGGWLRVRNHRTGEVSSLRVGPWIQKTPASPAPNDVAPTPVPALNTAHGIDLLLKAEQIQALEARIQHMSNEFLNEKTRLEVCVDKLTQAKEVATRHIDSLHAQVKAYRFEAATAALQLIEAKSQQMALYEKATADAEAYHRQVNQLMLVNETLRKRETELSEHLERATKQLHDVRPITQIYSHREFRWVSPEELEDGSEVCQPLDPRIDNYGTGYLQLHKKD